MLTELHAPAKCETWCKSRSRWISWRSLMVYVTGSKDRLHRAKTIDLCQNPLTVRDPRVSRGQDGTNPFICRKSQSLIGHDKYRNGRYMMGKSQPSLVDYGPARQAVRKRKAPPILSNTLNSRTIAGQSLEGMKVHFEIIYELLDAILILFTECGTAQWCGSLSIRARGDEL